MERPDVVAAIVSGARAYVGTGFRPQGRGREGLDCLGLVLVSLQAAGCSVRCPANYRLVGHDAAEVLRQVAASGLSAVPVEETCPGDILVGFPNARQVHFAIRTERGVVEADWQLQRVIERCGWPDGRWSAAFRAAVEEAPLARGMGRNRAGDGVRMDRGRLGCRR